MASVLDDVTTALVALFTAALPLVPVYNDDPVTNEADAAFVLVGDDGDPESERESSFEQEWADLACSSRYERGSIPCSALASSGDTDPDATRSAAFALLAACESALRANRTLGGLVMTSQLTSGSTLLAQGDNGSWVIAQFEITYMAQV